MDVRENKRFSAHVFLHHVENEKVFYYHVDYVNNAKKPFVTISFAKQLVVSISEENFLKGIRQPSQGWEAVSPGEIFNEVGVNSKLD